MLRNICTRLIFRFTVGRYQTGTGLAFRDAVSGSRFLAVKPGEAAIRVTPESAMYDNDKLRISISGLEKQQHVTLHSVLKENNMTFAALGHYVTGDGGNVDTVRDPSTGGSYIGVEPLGLLWGMEQAPGQRSGLRLKKADVTVPCDISLSVHRSHISLDDLYGGHERDSPLVTASMERSYMAEGVERVPVRHGRVRGTLFVPVGAGRFPAVIDMFGFTKGIIETRSALFASNGIVSLALPYVGYEDLPNTDYLDIEYFEEATEVLLTQEKVIKDKGIGVIGVSFGAGIALAMAEFIPKVKAVVAINGHSFPSMADLKHVGRLVKRAEKPDWDGLKTFEDGVATMEDVFPATVDDDRMYRIECSDASFMFITGLDDQCTPVAASCAAPTKLCEIGKTNFEYLQYPGAGHLIEPPCTPHVPYTYHIYPNTSVGLLLRWGGERHAHARAQADSWQRILNFFNEKLR